jgi:aminoglycoside phosphotransferase (APT) family kinase protein
VEQDRATIRRLIGAVAVEPLGVGLDHRVYAVGKRFVARFGEGVEREAALLTAIAPRLPLPVPAPVAVGDGCLVETRIPGTPLLAVERGQRRRFVPELLAFADAVHALDPGVEVPEDDTTLEDWLAEADLVATVPPAPPRVFIHGDLGAEHIFVDGGRVTGVIDWGDAVIGDPDLDRGRLRRDLGPSADGGERARLYAICTALEDLAFGKDIYVANARAALDELT